MSLSASFFVSSVVHEQPVKLGDEDHIVHFLEVPAIELIKMQSHLQSADEDVRACAMSKILCKSICDPDGKLSLPEKDALRLTTEALQALFAAFLKVNGRDKDSDAGKL